MTDGNNAVVIAILKAAQIENKSVFAVIDEVEEFFLRLNREGVLDEFCQQDWSDD